MNKDNNYREKSNIEADCEEGLLFCGWTNKWGVKVYAWYEKDLITFSFIEKGKQGKGKSFDVSVPAKKNYYFDFYDFMHEVLHDIRTPYDFVTCLEYEKAQEEKYPKRYKFISGTDGEKMVGFCNSSAEGREYCLNASAVKDGKKVVVNMPMSYYDIYELVEAFASTYKEREAQLKQLRIEGIALREERIKTSPKTVTGLDVRTISNVEEQLDGEYTVGAVTNAGQEITIRFTKEAIQQMTKNRTDCFSQFCQRVEQRSTEFRFSGKTVYSDGKTEYLFEHFETKRQQE